MIHDTVVVLYTVANSASLQFSIPVVVQLAPPRKRPLVTVGVNTGENGLNKEELREKNCSSQIFAFCIVRNSA